MNDSRTVRMSYLWLCLAASVITFVGFSFTYFRPMITGEYPEVSPAVHIHGWSFFLWYLLLPVQAGLVKSKRVGLHRTLGYSSLGLAAVMIATGMIVIGVQMDLAQQPGGSPFWQALGPGIFSTLVLFGAFYALAIRYRRKRELHKRLMLLASTGGMGAAGFRIMAEIIGPGFTAGVAGILLPNLIIVAAMVLEARRDRIHKVYLWGLPISVATQIGVILVTPTRVGGVLADVLAWIGRGVGPLY